MQINEVTSKSRLITIFISTNVSRFGETDLGPQLVPISWLQNALFFFSWITPFLQERMLHPLFQRAHLLAINGHKASSAYCKRYRAVIGKSHSGDTSRGRAFAPVRFFFFSDDAYGTECKETHFHRNMFLPRIFTKLTVEAKIIKQATEEAHFDLHRALMRAWVPKEIQYHNISSWCHTCLS